MQRIELTDKDAELFLKFREHQDVFAVLEQAGVFNVRNGKAMLNFNSQGHIMDIDCTIKTFKRGVEVIPILINLHTP